mgnify:CR=1 FL=1
MGRRPDAATLNMHAMVAPFPCLDCHTDQTTPLRPIVPRAMLDTSATNTATR